MLTFGNIRPRVRRNGENPVSRTAPGSMPRRLLLAVTLACCPALPAQEVDLTGGVEQFGNRDTEKSLLEAIDKIEVLSIAEVIADAINAVFRDTSVSEIFGGNHLA